MARLKDLAVVAALLLNVGMVAVFATSIQGKLDTIASRSMTNCVLLRSALVLSVEQSLDGDQLTLAERERATRIEQGFERVICS